MGEDPLLGYGLRAVALSDRSRLSAYFQSIDQPLSDYTFSQLFTWSNSLRLGWTELHGQLCVFANGTGDLTLLLPPIGQGDASAAIKAAFEIMDDYNSIHGVPDQSRIEYVSEQMLARLDVARLQVAPQGVDYLYDVNRMIDLAGGELASKRQLKNRFLRNYESRVELYDSARHQAECLQLLQLWKGQQDAHDAAPNSTAAMKRQKETLACELALEHAASLELKGLVVYVKGGGEGECVGDWSLRGFTLGEYLGQDQSSILIEKTDLTVRGLAQFIFSEFCRACWSDRPLVNASDDWGLPSLAWTKMSYRPIKLLQKYTVRPMARVRIAVPDPVVADVQQSASMPISELLTPGMLLAASQRELPIFEPTMAPAQPAESLATDSGTPVLRLARKEDLDGALVLEQTCFSAHCITKRQLSYLQQRPSALFMVAEQGGQIIGEGISLVRRNRNGTSGRIYSLAVSGAFRRHHIGQRLLEAMVEQLLARGVKRISLEVEASNIAAIKLYERHGFRTRSVLPDYYGQGRPGLKMVLEPQAAGCLMAADPASASDE